MAVLELFFKMLIGHAVCDFALQSDAMGGGKNRHKKITQTKSLQFPGWYYWMTAHALIHGGAVYLITANLVLGLIETVLHWIIDFCKCEGWIGVGQDQTLHILCKIGYCWWLIY